MQSPQMYLKVFPLLILPLLIVVPLPSNLAIAQTTTQTQVSDNKAISLTLQKPIARELKGGETHGYVVSLKAGQFFQAIAEQQGIDLVILLYSPNGKLIARSDSPNDRLGLEVMSVIADGDGDYRLEINAPDSKAVAGKYVLKVEELRVATELDKKYVVAERAFMEAVVLNEKQTRESRQQALVKCLEAVTVFKEQRKLYWENFANVLIGRIYSDSGDYQKAIDFYQQSIIITKKISDLNGEADLLNGLGVTYNDLGQYQKAIDFLQQSLTIKKQMGDRIGEGRLLNDLGLTYNNLGKYHQAINCYQNALTIFKKIGNRRSEAISLNNLGEVYRSLGEYQKAIDFLQQSLTIKKQMGDRNSESKSLNNLGAVYSSIGEYQKAINLYQQSLKTIKQIGNRNDEASLLNNIGNAYNSLGEYQKAIDFIQQSLIIKKQIGDRNGEAVSLNNLGLAYNNLGQYQKAIDFYQKSLLLTQQIGDRNGEATSIVSIGLAYNNLRQSQKAIDFYKQALVIIQQVGNRSSEARLLNNLGLAYASLGEYQKAIDFYQQSFAIFKQIGEHNSEATSLNNLGVIYSNIKQYQKAIDFYQQSLAIKKQSGDRNIEAKSLNNLAFTLDKLKQPELAILFYKQAINVIESIRKDIKGLSKEEQKSYLSTVEYTYRNLADLLLKQDRILEAQQVLDLLKVQELSDYLRTVRGNSQTAKGVDIQRPEQNIIALGSELSELQKLDRLTPTQEQRLAYLTNQESDRNQQFNAFLQSPEVQKQIKQLSLEKAKNVDLEEYNRLRESLSQVKNAALFYPLILDDRLELILITATTAPIRKTVNLKREELNKSISDFMSSLRDPSSSDVKDDGQKFYNYLIKPFEKELEEAKIQTIIYAPDGQLRYIPLAALYDGKQWLVERYRINNITASSLTNLRPRTYKQPRVLAAAATNSQNVNSIAFGALPATKTEVEAISSLIPRTTILLDRKFNKNDTVPKMQSNTIVHLATHGYFAVGQPEESFIVFGDSSSASIADIKKWTLTNVELVVLSACETAIGGKVGNGIEILGLGYQIQSAGAGASIASLWKVSDEGTQALMQKLYESLKQKDMSSSEALRQSQIAMIHSDKQGMGSDRASIRVVGTLPNVTSGQFSHPFYWSAFILIGNGL